MQAFEEHPKNLMVLNSVPKKGAGQYCPAPYAFYYLTNL